MIMCATPLKKMASCVCFSDGSGKYKGGGTGFFDVKLEKFPPS